MSEDQTPPIAWDSELPQAYRSLIYENRRELVVDIAEQPEGPITLDSLIENPLTPEVACRALGALSLLQEGLVDLDKDNPRILVLSEQGKSWAAGLQIMSPRMHPYQS